MKSIGIIEEIERLKLLDKDHLINELIHAKVEISYLKAINSDDELNNRIMKAIEYGKECINKNLDLDTLNEPYRSVFTACYEIHGRYEKILKGEENDI